MPVIDGLGWTFNNVAEQYEKYRPGYADDLYKAIFEYCPIKADSNVVEIGIGAGQATLPVLKTGCRLTAVEPGERFSQLCREKFNGYPTFSVINEKFEDAVFDENTVDMVFSASAFHWIPEEIGYKKVFEMLKSGGIFARFANHPFRDKGNPELSEEIDEQYRKYYSVYHGRTHCPPAEYTEKDAEQRSIIAEKYGFTDIQHHMFYRIRTFTAEEYIKLLGTYSDHIVISEPIRSEFFSKIYEAIERYGGRINIYDTMDLQLARKP